MFLKSMELSGFKSFADKTLLRFDEGITGIVGPNGCGKSNINDAIRWVLGEQSAKSLRSGSSMSDIIFSGSVSRKPVNLARVSLVFDNTARIFASPFDEIEITREIRRNGDTACFINKTPCRLKDISDLVMDTGLGRDSLSIISQGNISSFADARPEERRLLFEEAAGVAKYKKRKKISLGRLENMKENLDRVQDLMDELERQVDSLQEQADRAREYMAYSSELSGIEISVLAIQIGEYKERLEELNQNLLEDRGSMALNAAALDEKESILNQVREDVLHLDQEIASLQNRYSEVREESYTLQRRKDQLDEKRKYALEAADAASRAAAVKEMAEEARFEYEDRQNRLRTMSQKLEEQNQKAAASRSRLQDITHQIEQKNSQISSLEQKKAAVQNRLKTSGTYSHGVQAVLQAGKALSGMEGTVRSLLRTDPEYDAALQSALGGALDQIVTSDEKSARTAIAWLKKNRAGRATFLPLTVCKGRTLYDSQKKTADSCEGILGIMADFVTDDPRYRPVRDRLLGNILVADTLEHANMAASRLKYALKIVTLDGDVVHAGGAMSGGSMKNSSAASVRRELESLQSALHTAKSQLQGLENRRSQAEKDLDIQNETAIQMRIDYEKLDNVLKVKQEKFRTLQAEYTQLAGMAADIQQENPREDSLVVQLSRIHEQLDTLSSELKAKRTARMEKNEDAGKLDGQVYELRKAIQTTEQKVHSMELEKARLETRMEEALMRLNASYSLTYEAALLQKQEIDIKSSVTRIRQLKNAIQKLGDVNLKAPAMLEETQEKLQTMERQKQELESAAGQLLDAISELDKTMIDQFQDMFDRINEQLDGVFKAMFGGGHAVLSMSDPQDILNTGIDIDVQPPGKMVKNIQTFSGGEKALIAISVLFAILKARTMPLCIFDEVEAALDQANVERFARYLKHFKDQSQFIVVTHRPGTMEECDTLYGITMQKDGVSQVLKVLLQDAAEYAKEQA